MRGIFIIGLLVMFGAPLGCKKPELAGTEKMELASSASAEEAPKATAKGQNEAVRVVVYRPDRGLLVDGKVLAPPGTAPEGLPANVKAKGAADLRVTPLVDELETHRAPGHVVVAFDASTPYRIVTEVLFSVGQAGPFPDLLVRHGDGLSIIPIKSPASGEIVCREPSLTPQADSSLAAQADALQTQLLAALGADAGVALAKPLPAIDAGLKPKVRAGGRGGDHGIQDASLAAQADAMQAEMVAAFGDAGGVGSLVGTLPSARVALDKRDVVCASFYVHDGAVTVKSRSDQLNASCTDFASSERPAPSIAAKTGTIDGPALAACVAALKRFSSSRPDARPTVSASPETRWRDVVVVLDALRAEGHAPVFALAH